MGISIDFQPAASVVANAAQTAGLGEYRARQQQVAMQQAQMALQDQHFQQQLAAQLYEQRASQLANQNSQVFHAQQQQQMFGLNREADQQDMQQRRQWQTADATQKRGWDQADQSADWQHADTRAQTGLDWAWGTRSAEQAEAAVGKTMAQYQGQRQYMTDEGKRLLGDLTGKLRAIQAKRAEIRPQQYGQLLGQFGDEMQRAGLDAHVQQPKTIAERIPAETYHEPVTSPDGEFMGWNVWSSTVRNGQSSLTNKFIPKNDKAAETAKADSMAPHSFEHLYSNRETFNKDFADTQKELIAQAKASAAEDGSIPTVTHQDVVGAMKKKFEAWQGVRGTSPAQVTPAGGQAQPGAASLPPPPKPASGSVTKQDIEATLRATNPDFDKHFPELLSRVTPAKVAEVAKQAASAGAPPPGFDPIKTAAFIEATQLEHERQSAADAKKTTTVSQLPSQVRPIVAQHYPQPKTPAERDALAPGSQYVAPDGGLRTVPKRSASPAAKPAPPAMPKLPRFKDVNAAAGSDKVKLGGFFVDEATGKLRQKDMYGKFPEVSEQDVIKFGG